MKSPHLFFLTMAVGIFILSGISAYGGEHNINASPDTLAPQSSSQNEVTDVNNLYHFKSGDRIIFKTDWNPGFSRDDPFYVAPVPEGTLGTILDVAEKYVRVKLDDQENWPNPVLLWEDGLYDDKVEGGLSCIGKLVVN